MLYIIGTGAFAREVGDVALSLGLECTFGTEKEEEADSLIYREIWGVLQDTIPVGSHYILGMGNPVIRKRVAAKLSHLLPFSLIHPTTVLGGDIQIGEGTITTAGCILTNRIDIGKHNNLNLSTTIGHDCKTGDFCEMSPGCRLNGFSILGEGVSCGSGT